MTDRPIIFSAPMIRALLEGRKTQTRRVLKPQPKLNGKEWIWRDCAWFDGPPYIPRSLALPVDRVRFAPGDRLWVRENIARDARDGSIIFAADGATAHPKEQAFWRNSDRKMMSCLGMPRRISRLTLIVEDVRVERLQEISKEDARAEGAGLYVPGHGFIDYDELRADPGYSNFLAPRMGFEAIWSEIHGSDAWDQNPWVAAISFRVVKANIDTMEAARSALRKAGGVHD